MQHDQAVVAGTDGPDFAAFCADHLRHSIEPYQGVPFTLEPFQQAVMDEALRFKPDGTPVWTTVLLVIPRKNGKTELLAAYALWRLLVDDGQPEILLAASSNEQAGRLFDAAVRFIRQNDAVGDLVVVRDYDGEIERTDGGGQILRMASDAKRLHGYNPSDVVCDELAQWTTPRLRDAWEALTTGSGARTRARVFAITTAGAAHDRSSGLLGRMIDRAEQVGETTVTGGCSMTRAWWSGELVFQWSAPWPAANPKPLRDAHAQMVLAEHVDDDPAAVARARAGFEAAVSVLLPAWRAANPASFARDDYLLKQALSTKDESAVLQLHAGIWAESEDQWLTRDAWMTGFRHKQLRPGDVVALGFDGSRVSDATALVACRITDGFMAPLAVWESPEGVAGRGWTVPRAEVDAEVHDAFDRFVVTRMYADPPDWRSEIDAWALAWPGRVVEFPTGGDVRMGAALERFVTDLADGGVQHNDDQVLSRHVTNAVRSRNRHGYRITKPEKMSVRKIDCAVAAVLAYEARCDSVAAGETGEPQKRSGKVAFL